MSSLRIFVDTITRRVPGNPTLEVTCVPRMSRTVDITSGSVLASANLIAVAGSIFLPHNSNVSVKSSVWAVRSIRRRPLPVEKKRFALTRSTEFPTRPTSSCNALRASPESSVIPISFEPRPTIREVSATAPITLLVLPASCATRAALATPLAPGAIGTANAVTASIAPDKRRYGTVSCSRKMFDKPRPRVKASPLISPR